MKTCVAHVCVTPGLGGLELYSMHIHKMFKEEGYPSLHFCQENSPFEQKLKGEGLDYVSLPKTSYFSPKAIIKVRKEIKARGIKHIYIHHLKDLWFLVPALVGMPEVQLVGFAQMFIKGISKKDFLHEKLYNRMQALITLTDIQKEELKKCLPLKEDRYITIPNSVDMSKFEDLSEARKHIRNQQAYTEANTVIGIVGRLDPWKGQMELLQAFDLMSKEYSGLKLLIVGSETPGEEGYKKQLEDYMKENTLEKDVTLIPFQPNVNEWMSAMDIFVMPSYEEAFGIVLVEAMAAGLPVISTAAGGVPDILQSPELGTMVEPRSATAIAGALREYLSKPEKRSEIGERAQSYATEKYDLNKVYKQVKSLMSGL